MKWVDLAKHLSDTIYSQLDSFFRAVEIKLQEHEEASAAPLSFPYTSIRAGLKRRAARCAYDEVLVTRDTAKAVFAHEDQTREIKRQIWKC